MKKHLQFYLFTTLLLCAILSSCSRDSTTLVDKTEQATAQAEQTTAVTTVFTTTEATTKTESEEVTDKLFSFIVTKDMGCGIGELVFSVEGVFNSKNYYPTKIEKLTISNLNGEVRQEFSDLNTETFADEDMMYGLWFDDWNFDGYIDIGLWRYAGGTSLNAPHYYWFWDSEIREFVENKQLMEISEQFYVYADSESKLIIAELRKGYKGYIEKHYEHHAGEFIEVWSRETERIITHDGEELVHVIIEELIDGELIETENYYVKANEFVF